MAIRIAVVQQNGNPGKPDENREKAVASALIALEKGADVILFHEELLLGYTREVERLAEPVDGPATHAFRDVLQGSEAIIVYGLTERDGNDLYIAAPVVSSQGVIANYRKTHLWWHAKGLRHEPTFYRPGNRLVTFKHNGHELGIMICYDGDFPEMTRGYARMGCGVVLWMNNRESRGHSEVKDLARRNSMIIAASCCCGTDETGQICPGGSNITDEDGRVLSEIWDDEGIIVADVDPEKAVKKRRDNPLFVGLRPELYYGSV